MSLSRIAARALEAGQFGGLLARALASAASPLAARGLVRPLSIPAETALVCVGGATLGGSGKTRVAIACASELASLGLRVALVGHAYRAAPRAPRVVDLHDPLAEVGDEALVCARALADVGVPVVIGPTRQAAVDRALALDLDRRPDVLVLDGPLDVRGRDRERTVSLLAVDANRPWGSGRLPPAGDLRAARELLLARADHVVAVPATPACVRWGGGDRAPLGSLKHGTFGLFTAIARPDRLVRALDALGIRPREIVSVADHGPLAAARRRIIRSTTDVWIATEKCALHLEGVPFRAPLGVLEAGLLLPTSVLSALRALKSPIDAFGQTSTRGTLTPPMLQP